MAERDRSDESDLTELLSETRILLPGTEVFLGFLTTLPFSSRFDSLSASQKGVYMCTYFSTLLAFVILVAPSAYHRICRPIQDKARFKAFASTFLVAGLVPVSIVVVLASYLIASMVLGDRFTLVSTAVVAAVVAALWWLVPFARAHDRFPAGKARKVG